MKRFVKGMLKAVWRLTNPLRRPFVRKTRLFIAECLQPSERLVADEANMLMNHVIRELVRLQRQVETLQQTVEDHMAAQSGIAVAGEIEPPKARPARERRAG